MNPREALDVLNGYAVQAARSRHGELVEIEKAYETLGDVLDGLEDAGWEWPDDD